MQPDWRWEACILPGDEAGFLGMCHPPRAEFGGGPGFSQGTSHGSLGDWELEGMCASGDMVGS